MPASRRRRPSGRSIAWVFAWILVGAIVIASNVGDDVVLGNGSLRLDASNRIEVEVRSSREVRSPCEIARDDASRRVTGDGSGGRHLAVPVETGLCSRAPAGLTGASFSYVVMLSGESSGADARSVWSLFVVQMLAILIGAYAFVEMLSLALRRSLFTHGTVLWLRLIAACVVFGGIVVPYVAHRLELVLIERFVPAIDSRSALDPTGSGPSVAPFVIVAMVLAFAEVWRRGIALRRDVEATI